MTNGEKYESEIVEFCKNAKNPIINNDFCQEFINPKILIPLGLKCEDGISNFCDACIALQSIWLNKEYKEPEFDWSKVAVDTPIRATDDGKVFYRRHFAKFEHGVVYVWEGGATSWTANNDEVEFWASNKVVEERGNDWERKRICFW